MSKIYDNKGEKLNTKSFSFTAKEVKEKYFILMTGIPDFSENFPQE